MQSNKHLFWQRTGHLGLALILGLWAAIATLASFVNSDSIENVSAATTILYVAASPVGNDTANSCASSAAPCATIQHAVNNASSGDELRIAAGTYSDLTVSNGLTQVVTIDISITVRGGYSSTNFVSSYPLTQSTILDAQTLGRGVVITGGITAVIENLTIRNGDALGQGGTAPVKECKDAGGGIFVDSATVTLTNNTVQTNTACHGGGVFILNSPAAVVIDNEISQNTADYYAGGLYIHSSDDATVSNNDIFQNVANVDGGKTKNCGGGRIYKSSRVQLIENSIYENIAANNGGGFCLDEANNALMQNNLIHDNMRKASHTGGGAGIYIESSDFVQIVQNSIYQNGGTDIDNLGTFTGGGVHARFADSLFLDRNMIYDNIATLGGGVYLLGSNSVESSANIIRNNRALDMPYNDEGFGGGIFVVNSDLSAENSVIIDNEADIVAQGSGVHIKTSDVLLQHPTIARNNPMTGTAVYISDITSTLSITNAIVVSHAIGIDASAGGTATVFDVLWYDNMQNTSGSVTVTEEITAVPQFKADGFHLAITSPALDQATPSTITTDIDGELRPSCVLLPDLGADERSCILYLPLILNS